MGYVIYYLVIFTVIILLYILIKTILSNIIIHIEDSTTNDVIVRKDVELKIDTEELGETVPKQIMQTYKSLDKVPEFVIKNIKKDNPDWKYIFYSDEDAEKFLEEEYPPPILEKFKSFSRGAHKADLFRLCWLYKNGGVYVDIDTHLLKPVNDIIGENDLIIPITLVSKKRTRLLNCFMVSKKGDPLILKCIYSIMKIKDEELKYNYCLILRVMQKCLEGEYDYEFFEKSTKHFFGGETWHIYDKMDNKIAESRYENYDQIKGFE